MSIIANNLLQGDDGYNIQRSLRFRSSASAYLNRTPASAGNRTTWTWSGWVKVGALSGTRHLFSAGSSGTEGGFYLNNVTNGIDLYNFSSAAFQFLQSTNQVFRDPSAWYHIVCVLDTNNATAADRARIYVNGVRASVSGGSTTPSLSYAGCQINTTNGHYIASLATANYFDCYMADINFIDGQALTPSSFGEFDAQTGVWKPKKYAGTYGTNGFFLNFSDNSSNTATTIGKDYSGNGNNWTPNNISVTAGSTYDSMVDVPTMSALGSNYAVLNPLNAIGTTATFSNANLGLVLPDGSLARTAFATMGVSSGKWYWEMTVGTTAATYYPGIGVNTNTSALPTNQSGADATGYMYMVNGQKFNNGSLTSYGATYATNDVIGVALDMDAGTITFYKNNTTQGQAFSGLSGTAVPCFIGQVNASCAVNFGQRPFTYTPPTGFKELNTFNLPDATIKAGNKHFDATTYTGNGSARSITNAGSFPAEFVWLKDRSTAYNHQLYDIVRGALNYLPSSGTDAESQVGGGGVTAFNSNGFSLGTNSGINTNGDAYVAWQWKANGSAVSNTAGSITSQVSANTSAGFSVVTYTGTGANATVGHGLGVAPKMVIVKQRTSASATSWAVLSMSANSGSGYLGRLLLNDTSAYTTDAIWNNTAPTSSVFSIASGYSTVNANSGTYVAYCFSEVAGYSKFGSYTGNGSADGTFVHLGFRPKFVMTKVYSSSGYNWNMYDSSRAIYNENSNLLVANASGAEETGYDPVDFLSNGFKLRMGNRGSNVSGASYIYMAFAENPFKYSLAR